MKFAGYQQRRHALAVQKKTMRRRQYQKVLRAIFTPEDMRRGRYASMHQEARRSSWARSFGRTSPIFAPIARLLTSNAEKRKAREKANV